MFVVTTDTSPLIRDDFSFFAGQERVSRVKTDADAANIAAKDDSAKEDFFDGKDCLDDNCNDDKIPPILVVGDEINGDDLFDGEAEQDVVVEMDDDEEEEKVTQKVLIAQSQGVFTMPAPDCSRLILPLGGESQARIVSRLFCRESVRLLKDTKHYTNPQSPFFTQLKVQRPKFNRQVYAENSDATKITPVSVGAASNDSATASAAASATSTDNSTMTSTASASNAPHLIKIGYASCESLRRQMAAKDAIQKGMSPPTFYTVVDDDNVDAKTNQPLEETFKELLTSLGSDPRLSLFQRSFFGEMLNNREGLRLGLKVHMMLQMIERGAQMDCKLSTARRNS